MLTDFEESQLCHLLLRFIDSLQAAYNFSGWFAEQPCSLILEIKCFILSFMPSWFFFFTISEVFALYCIFPYKVFFFFIDTALTPKFWEVDLFPEEFYFGVVAAATILFLLIICVCDFY